MKKVKGDFITTPSGRKSYEIYEADAGCVFKASTKIEEKFGFIAEKLPVMLLDDFLIELKRDDLTIAVCWDIWSGFYVMSWDEKSDYIIQEIGEYLDSIIDEWYEEQPDWISPKKDE